MRTEIKQVKSWKQALYYVSKYMAKPEFGPPLGAGDVRREADAPPEAAGRSLVYVAYLTGDGEAAEEAFEVTDAPSIGRSWGIFNRKALPWAKRRVFRGRAGVRLEVARHLAKQKWAGIDESENTGFTLFLEDADKVFDELRSIWIWKPKP